MKCSLNIKKLVLRLLKKISVNFLSRSIFVKINAIINTTFVIQAVKKKYKNCCQQTC